MGIDRDDRLAELEEDNELEDAEFGNLSRRARRKMLEERMGKKEVAQQLADGMLSLGKKGVEYVQTRRVKTDETARLHGVGPESSSRLKNLNDPAAWPKRGQ